MADVDQPAGADATKPDPNKEIDHLDDGFADTTLVGIQYQAEMTATYYLKLRAMKVPTRQSAELTAEWLNLGQVDED